MPSANNDGIGDRSMYNGSIFHDNTSQVALSWSFRSAEVITALCTPYLQKICNCPPHSTTRFLISVISSRMAVQTGYDQTAMRKMPDPSNRAFIASANVASEDGLAGDASTAPTEAGGIATRHFIRCIEGCKVLLDGIGVRKQTGAVRCSRAESTSTLAPDPMCLWICVHV